MDFLPFPCQLSKIHPLFSWAHSQMCVCTAEGGKLSRGTIGDEGWLKGNERTGRRMVSMRLPLTDRAAIFPRDAFLSFTEKCWFVAAEQFKIWKHSWWIFWVGKTWFENYQGTPVSYNQGTKSGRMLAETYHFTWSLNLYALKYPKPQNQNGTIWNYWSKVWSDPI